MTDAAEPTLEDRQATRLSALPAVYKDRREQLAFELALAAPEDRSGVFAAHNYTPDAALALLSDPAFAKQLDRATREVHETGVSFRTKARVQAEDLLQYSYALATDPEVSSAVRLDAIKSTVKWAGLEPREKDGAGGGGGFTLNLVMPGAAPQQVITATPLTIEG